MAEQCFEVVADVSSDTPAAIEPVLRKLAGGAITGTTDGFHVETTMTGVSARDLNRAFLSALRRVERRTRIRSEWTAGQVTYRFSSITSLRAAAQQRHPFHSPESACVAAPIPDPSWCAYSPVGSGDFDPPDTEQALCARSVFLDDVRSRPRLIEELRLVSADLPAWAWSTSTTLGTRCGARLGPSG